MARRMKPETAVRKARALYVLERGDNYRGEQSWITRNVETGDASGVIGDEESGVNHHEKTIMFRALEMIDSEYDWHKLDWHLLKDKTAESRVAQMVAWRQEQEEAAAAVEPFHALVRAVMNSTFKKG